MQKDRALRTWFNQDILRGFTYNKALIFLIWFIISTILITIPFFSVKVYLKPGDIATYTVFSPLDKEFETEFNRIATEELRKQKAEAIQNVYDVDTTSGEKALVFNPIKTNKLKAEAQASIVPFRTTVFKNQPLFFKGDTITPEHIEILKILGLYGSKFAPATILSGAVLNLLCLYLLFTYLRRYRKNVFNNDRLLLLLGLVSLFIFACARYLTITNQLFLPIIAAAMIYAIASPDIIVGFILSFYVCLFSAVITSSFSAYFLFYIFSSLLSIYFTRQITDRSDIVKAGMYTAIGSTLVFVCVFTLANQQLPGGLLPNTLIIFGNAMASVVFVLGILPYIEGGFNILTPIKLMELAAPNNPLLKRLMLEAPGTYHHSLMVANLAEAGVEAIGGNALLARVGAYYHDIGKLNRPYFFIENQTGIDNPHNQLNAKLSSLIILAHTKEGVELGLQYKLPKAILDIIQQHHGTTMAHFFYSAHLEALTKEGVDAKDFPPQEDFAYAGPKPQTREAAAVLLADACEAAIRTLEKPSPSKISATIQKIVKTKLEQNQLDECNMTFRDISQVTTAFTTLFTGIYHHRIKYPEQTKA